MASVVGIPIAEGLWFHAATVDDTLPVITLWQACHLVRTWNDPVEDMHFCLQPTASELLLAFEGDEIVGSIMMGNDGHRGWVYYLGVASAWRRSALRGY
jgi:hypothetical protein